MNINDKSSSNQMRILMQRMRKGYISESNNMGKNNLSMRDLLGLTRKLNENVEDHSLQNKETVYDQSQEEDKFRNMFKDMTVDIKFDNLEVYDNYVFWGGTIDGMVQFVYKVTSDESTSGVEFNYLPTFTPDNPDNDEIIKRIEMYYDTFYKYWRDNILQ